MSLRSNENTLMADLQYCDLLYLALEMYDTMTLWFIFKTHSSALIDKI